MTTETADKRITPLRLNRAYYANLLCRNAQCPEYQRPIATEHAKRCQQPLWKSQAPRND